MFLSQKKNIDQYMDVQYLLAHQIYMSYLIILNYMKIKNHVLSEV